MIQINQYVLILYKEKKSEGLPDFLLNDKNKLKLHTKNDNNNSLNIQNFFQISSFPNGIYNEELYSSFSNAEIMGQNNNNKFKDFFYNNMIAIYIPNRYIIPSKKDDKNIHNDHKLILIDSINNLNAEFIIGSPTLNGVHIFQNLYEDDFGILGGLNNLLPILEFILDNNEFLNIEIFSSFFNLLTFYIFIPKYKNALIKENNSNFFKCLSYFLEKMPDYFFNDELAENFRIILLFLSSFNDDNNLDGLVSQFHNYILINEKFFFKFSETNQQKIINSVCLTAGRKDVDINIIKIIKIMLHYDRNRKYEFCCKKHSEYFIGNYSIMAPELSEKIKNIFKLLEVIFEKTYKMNNKKNEPTNKNKKEKKSNNKIIEAIEKMIENNKLDDKNLFLLFYLLTFDISLCL